MVTNDRKLVDDEITGWQDLWFEEIGKGEKVGLNRVGRDRSHHLVISLFTGFPHILDRHSIQDFAFIRLSRFCTNSYNLIMIVCLVSAYLISEKNWNWQWFRMRIIWCFCPILYITYLEFLYENLIASISYAFKLSHASIRLSFSALPL